VKLGGLESYWPGLSSSTNNSEAPILHAHRRAVAFRRLGAPEPFAVVHAGLHLTLHRHLLDSLRPSRNSLLTFTVARAIPNLPLAAFTLASSYVHAFVKAVPLFTRTTSKVRNE
jgi:hypothetical protein